MMHRIGKINPALWFLLKLAGLYTLWHAFFPVAWCNGFLTRHLAGVGVGGLRLFGLDAHREATTLYVEGQPLLYIGDPCNGLDFFGLFACFVLAFPARRVAKLWFLPLGLLTIHLLNALRVVVLCLNYWYFRSSFDFNHKYTFVVIVYGVMLLLWMRWARKYAPAAGGAARARHA
jgi:exosortase/archaeosortase family protein